MNTSHFDAITKALNFDSLSGEEQEELLLDLNTLIFRGSLVRLVERMDDDTRDLFNKLIEKNPTEELMEQFLMTHVPDADKAVAETIEDLTNDILAVTHE
jgi:hypothetical protein